MKDDLLFKTRPPSRLVGSNQDATSERPLSYKVDLRPLRDGYCGRTGSEAFPGAAKLGPAIGAAMRGHIKEKGLAKDTSRFLIQAVYAFMRFKNVMNIPDSYVIDWDTLVQYQDYLNDQLISEKLGSAIPKYYSTIALLTAKLSPSMDIPANPFFTEMATPKRPNAACMSDASDPDSSFKKSQQIVMAAYDEFEKIETRFETGFLLASSGSDPRLELSPRDGSRASRSTILRAYTLENTLNLLQNQHAFEPTAASDFKQLYGIRTDYLDHHCDARGECWNTGLANIQNWVLPSLTDLVAPFMLCNEFIGWNESVMLSLRSSTVSAALAGIDNGEASIWSMKGRASELQRARVISSPPFGPLDILGVVNRWGHPLRRKLQGELDHLRCAKRNGHVTDTEQLNERIEWLEGHVDRLWLAFDRKKTGRVVPLRSDHICSRQFDALLISHNVFQDKYTNRSARKRLAERAESSTDSQSALVSFLFDHKRRETTERHYLSNGRAIARVGAAIKALTAQGRAKLAGLRESAA
jgi:hypothetical protein